MNKLIDKIAILVAARLAEEIIRRLPDLTEEITGAVIKKLPDIAHLGEQIASHIIDSFKQPFKR